MSSMKIKVLQSSREHTFFSITVDGELYWYDSTEAAKLKAFDSVKLYQNDGERLMFRRYLRKGLLGNY